MKRIDNISLNLTHKSLEDKAKETKNLRKRAAEEITSQSTQIRNKRGQRKTSQEESSEPAPTPTIEEEEGEIQQQRVKPNRKPKSDKHQKKEPLGGIYDNSDDSSDSSWNMSPTPVDEDDGLEKVDYDEEGLSDHDHSIENLRIGKKKVDTATIVSTWRANTVERLDAAQVASWQRNRDAGVLQGVNLPPLMSHVSKGLHSAISRLVRGHLQRTDKVAYQDYMQSVERPSTYLNDPDNEQLIFEVLKAAYQVDKGAQGSVSAVLAANPLKITMKDSLNSGAVPNYLSHVEEQLRNNSLPVESFSPAQLHAAYNHWKSNLWRYADQPKLSEDTRKRLISECFNGRPDSWEELTDALCSAWWKFIEVQTASTSWGLLPQTKEQQSSQPSRKNTTNKWQADSSENHRKQNQKGSGSSQSTTTSQPTICRSCGGDIARQPTPKCIIANHANGTAPHCRFRAEHHPDANHEKTNFADSKIGKQYAAAGILPFLRRGKKLQNGQLVNIVSELLTTTINTNEIITTSDKP